MDFARESFSEIMGELPELISWHHAEIEGPTPAYPLEFNWQGYVQLDRMGMFHVVTARDNGKLVGYGFITISQHMHSRRMVNSFVNTYLLPEYRDGWAGLKLMRFIDKTMTELGVDIAHAGTHPLKNISSLYKRLGYTLNEVVYSKRLRK